MARQPASAHAYEVSASHSYQFTAAHPAHGPQSGQNVALHPQGQYGAVAGYQERHGQGQSPAAVSSGGGAARQDNLPPPVPWHSKFRSRFTIQAREVSHRRLLSCMCTFAAAAECFNAVAMPNHNVRSYDVTGLLCNLLGALLGGIALQLCDFSQTLGDVFRGGFISCYTSYCFMVEETATLFCQRHPRALQYLVFCILLGPCFFEIGRSIGTPILRILKFFHHGPVESSETVKALLTSSRLAMMCWVVIAISMEAQLRGSIAAIELTTGVLLSMLAVVVGDTVGMASQAIMDFESDVNWGTIFANVVALLVLSATRLFSLSVPDLGIWTALVLSKVGSSFCGTLSGYGAFSEDVADQISKSNLEVAATNLGMNALVAIVFVALLDAISCSPFVDPSSTGLNGTNTTS